MIIAVEIGLASLRICRLSYRTALLHDVDFELRCPITATGFLNWSRFGFLVPDLTPWWFAFWDVARFLGPFSSPL
jgi:hypothetical protein